VTLGKIISQLNDEALVQEALAGLDDFVLLARLRSAADTAEESLASFTAALVGHFMQHASDEAWMWLITAATRAHDPAAAILHGMLVAMLPDAGPSRQVAHVHEAPG
jgi:hypothetical protein